jgi:hypothetical protein
MHRSIVIVLLALMFTACDRADSPSSPSGTLGPLPVVSDTASISAIEGTQGSMKVPHHLLHPVQFPMLQGLIEFPGRQDPNAFYNDLTALYRDYLKRSQSARSYVDPEGENVWLTEYFRFYLNGCSHEEATARTIEEIRTGGVQPVCGGESASLAFPPRNLPYEFQAVLENTYRDMLRRSQQSYYVDSEGANVWLAEYLRYRLQGARCGHVVAEAKVFAQIRGGVVQPACGPTDQADTVAADGIDMWELTATGTGTGGLWVYLLWVDASADLDLYLTDSSCNGYPPAECRVLAASVGDSGTSEWFSFGARAGDRYRVWVDNFSMTPQPYWLSVLNTPGFLATEGGADTALSKDAVRMGRKPADARKIR